MVDAIAGTSDGNGLESVAYVGAPPASRAVCLGGHEALAAYREHCLGTLYAPPQHPLWLECWARNRNADMISSLLVRDQTVVLALPLEIVRDRGVVTARFAGGSHANGNFPAMRADLDPPVSPAETQLLIAAIARARPDIDILRLERMTRELRGQTNPLWHLPGMRSPNPALAVSLAGGFEAVLSRASAKRKKKKHRYQTRKFEAAGGIRCYRAADRAQTDRLLDDFFAMKATRFASMGIHDVFADEGVPGFFRDLFGSALEQENPPFVLDVLEVGGKPRAITGNSLTRDSLICDFGAIAEDELAYASPGEFLFHECIRAACKAGYSVYDFSVGDEPYKRLWCDVETAQKDVLLSLGPKGHAARMLILATARAKRFVKSNRVLWEGVKRLRRRSPAEQIRETD